MNEILSDLPDVASARMLDLNLIKMILMSFTDEREREHRLNIQLTICTNDATKMRMNIFMHNVPVIIEFNDPDMLCYA